jgi:putative heme-binding domain-containing protein
MIWVALLLAQSAVTPQIERGQSLFYDASQGCGTCHALRGRGTAVGPDLRGMGRLSPQAIATAVHSTVTAYVQTAKLKSGESFSAMPVAQDDKVVQVYDLSKSPPELRKIERPEITMANHDGSWKHMARKDAYTNEQLADIIAYVRYAASGSKKPVDPSEVQ